MPLNFCAIDFETANFARGSPCAVGLVRVEGGVVVETSRLLMRPPEGLDWFDDFNIELHGITPAMVQHEPRFAARLPEILAFARGLPLVAHNAGFDMGVIAASCAASYLPSPTLDYLCSLQVARKTYHLNSYRLPVAAMAAGFEDFEHHNALADSLACAAIIVHAAARHEASTLEELSAAAGAPIKRLGASLSSAETPG